MLVVFLLAAVVVLGGVFFAATGRGGELAREFPDYAPLDLGPVAAPDIALLRPPTALWGYNVQATDEALDQIARAMRDRDVTIAHLQQQLAGRAAAAPSASPPSIAAQNPPSLLGSPTAGTQPPQTGQPFEVTPPSAATRPADPALPAEATQPAEALPVSAHDVPGPQGAYDAHDWWAQQEAAAREEALRQAQAKADAEASSGDLGPPASAWPQAVPPADRDESRSSYPSTQPNPGATSTQPNPAVTSTQPNPAVTSQPDDDARAVAEEQSW